MKFLYCLLFSLLLMFESYSQKDDFQPDMSRALFHGKVDKAQQQLLALDGKRDEQITADADEEINMQLTYQATTRIDNIQKEIEFNKELNSNQKIGYIRGLQDLV